MTKKSLLFKTIATIVATGAVTLSVAAGSTVGRVIERNDNNSQLPTVVDGKDGQDGRGISAVEKTNTYGLIDEYTITYTDDTTSTFIVVNGADGEQGIQGFPGSDGHTPTIEIGDNGNWIINGTDTGVAVQGPKGDKGEDGQDGRSIVSIEKTNSEGLVDTYTITYSDETTSTFIVFNGQDGEQGIQGLPGEDGHTPTITIDATTGNWVIDGVDSGVKAQGPKGEDGRGIVSITRTDGDGTPGSVDTYTITYSDDTTSTFLVVNGANGEQGLQGIPGDDGHTPTITIDATSGIWVIDGVDSGVKAQGPKGEDGRGIVSIEKTSTSENVDTYTITYSDDTTSTFVVVNGTNGEQGLQGIPGDTPTVEIGENGHWFIDGVDSNVVAQGPKGDQGEQGEQGPQGEKGASVLIGADDPAADPLNPTDAREGDIFINITTGDIFKLEDDQWVLQGNIKGPQGQQGEQGVSVTSIERTDGDGSAGTVDTYTITYSDNTTSTFTVTNGVDGVDGATLLFGTTDPDNVNDGKDGDSYVNVSTWEYWVKESGTWTNKGSFRGEDGVSITNIEKTGSEGRVDTYTITYSDSTLEHPHTTSFTVTNGNTLIVTQNDPTDNIGNDGDSFLNTQTWEYFVKEGGTWVSQGHIRGTSFKTGHGNPNTNSVPGIDGDSYLDLDEWKFYSYNVSEFKWDLEANLFEKYTVTFVTNGGSEAPEAQTIREGQKVTKPDDPTKANYFFQGWYTQEGNKWNFEKDVVSGSITLYARWAQFEVTNGVLTGCTASGDVIVPSYFNDQMITEIGEGVFEDNDDISSITLPNTVSSIGANAFAGSSIEEVYLPEGLLTIGENAFKNCSSLTSVVIPNSVRTIGANAFDGATALKYVVFSTTNVRRINDLEIANNAFKGCEALTSLNLPNRVKTVGEGAFSGCTNLETLTVPFVGGSEDANQTLGYLFNSSVPASLKTLVVTGNAAIGANAFDGCTGIENLYFKGMPESFAKNALGSCSSLKTLEVPYLSASKDDAVTGSYLGYLFGADTYADNSANVPASLKTVVVTGTNGVNEYAFYGCSNIQNIAIENSASVGDHAFEGCGALESLKLNTTYSTNFYKLFGAADENETDTYVPHSLKNVELLNATSVPAQYFYNCRYLENITLNEGITSIGDCAFSMCIRLEKADIPSTVTSIGENGFSYCASLKSVVLPDNLTSLGAKAFLGCSSIQTIKLPKGLTSIPTSAFEGCSSLTYLSVPETVTSIADRAFANCQSLAIVTFNGDLTTLGSEAFAGCYALNNVVVPNVTGTLGTGVFKDCNALKFAVLPTNMTEIPESMFEGCSSLQNINIDQLTGLTTIGSHAFKNCASIKVIVISNSVQTIGAGVFAGCSSLESLTTPFVGGSRTENKTMYYMFDGATPSAIKLENKVYTEFDTNVPASLKVVRITDSEDIAQYAFAACANIKYVLIDCDITKINTYAFFGCYSLINIDFPDSLVEINSYAFAYCTSLTAIELPDATWMLYSYAFAYCTSLRSIEAYDLFEVGTRCFEGCTSLIDVTLYADMLGQYAFADCTSLDHFESTSMTTTIGSYIFSGCTNLKRVVISNSVTNIQSYAFYNCTSLTEIVVPNPATSIGNSAFAGCTNLESITLPLKSASSTLSSIFGGIQGLNACKKLRTINITQGSTVLGNSAFYGFNGSNVVINLPSTLKTIGREALAYTKGITSIVIPEGVKTIEQYALYNSEYVYIQLPSTLKTLGNNALAQNSYWKHLVIPSGVTSIGTGLLSNTMNIETLEVPFLGATNAMDDTKQFVSYYWGQISYTGNENGVPASLKTLVVGGGRDTIVANAFYWAKNLETVAFGEGVTTIESGAFYYCMKLKTIVLPESLRTVKRYAVNYALLLDSLVIPAGCTNIEYGAFWNCPKLKSLTLSLHPFDDNYTLNILNSDEDPIYSDGNNGDTWVNTKSGDYFYKVSDEWHLVGNVYRTYGYDGAYDYYSKLQYRGVLIADTAPTVVSNSYYQAWINASTGDFYWSISSSKTWELKGNIRPNCLTAMLGSALHIPSALENIIIRDAEYIPDYFFKDLTQVKNITLPEDIETIGEGAFENCHNLETVNIGNNVTSIGARAFYGCNSLKTINIPTSVTRIEDYAFYGCASLKDIVLHDQIVYLGDYSLAGCSSITSLVVPNSVNTIGAAAFKDCSSLESISLPFIGKNREIDPNYSCITYVLNGEKYNPLFLDYSERVSGISDSLRAVVLTGLNGASNDTLPAYSFAGLSNVEYITLPNSLTAIGDYAFLGCKSLTSYVVSNNVTSIGKGAFKECEDLESIVLPFIGSGSNDADEQYFAWIFDGTRFTSSAIDTYKASETNVPESLKTVVLSNKASGATVYEGAFAYCDDIKTVVLNNNYTSVGDYAFIGCSSLVNFELPTTVNSIGDYAFAGCNGWRSTSFYSGQGAPKVNGAIQDNAWYIDVDTGAIYTLENGTWVKGKYFFQNHKYSNINYEPDNSVGENGDIVYWNMQLYYKYNDTWHAVVWVYPNKKDSFNGYSNYIYIDTNTYTIYIWDRVTSTYTEGGYDYLLTGHGVPVPPGNYAEEQLISGRWYIDLDGTQTSASGNAIYLYNLRNYEWNPCELPIRIGHGDNPSAAIRVDREGDLYLDTLTNNVYEFTNGEWVLKASSVKEGTDAPYTGSVNANAGEYYFYNDSVLYVKETNGLETVTVPYGTTKVSANAFEGCTNLKTVILPETVTEIEDNAFLNCNALENVIAQGHITTVGDHAFDGDKKLKEFDFSYVTSVGAGAFANTSISHAYFTLGTVTKIGDNAFEGCNNLTNVVINNASGLALGNNSFKNCYSLNSVVLPNTGVLSIGNSAFENCYALASFRVPYSVTVIGSAAFMNCKSLSTLYLHSAITSIQENAFKGCNGLTRIVAYGFADDTAYETFMNDTTIVDSGNDALKPGGVPTIVTTASLPE